MKDTNEFLRGKPQDAGGEQSIRLLFKIVTFIVILIGVTASTQRFCAMVNYDPGWVGSPLYILRLGSAGIRIYNPLMIFVWMLKYWSYTEIHPYIYGAFRIAGIFSIAAIAFYFSMEYILIRNRKQNIFGTARWGTDRDMKKAGLLGLSGGIILGQTSDARLTADYDMSKNSVVLHMKKKGKQYLVNSGIYNVMLAAPTRSGKGVSNVIPTLLTYPGSMIVLDFKGENFDMTSGFRAKFGKVYRWNPTGEAEDPGHRFNPLMEVRGGENAFSDANLIADILTAKQDGPADHWSMSAKDFLTAVILHVLTCEDCKDKSLAGCRSFLAQVDTENPENNKYVYDLMLNANHGSDDIHQSVYDGASVQRARPDNEGGSVLGTVNTALSIFADAKIKRNTSESEFYIDEFEKTDVPITLYITIQYSDVARIAPLIRMFILLISRRFTSGETQATKRKFKIPILFILDEFDKLGRMDELETAAGIHNGFGIHYFWIFQSMQQLDKIYGKNHSFSAHARNSIYFAPGAGEYDNAELISKICGKESFSKANISYSGGRGGLGYNNASLSSQDQERNLINPDEVMKLPLDRFILTVQGMPPYIGKKNVFYEDPLFKSRMTGTPAFSTRAEAVKIAAATIRRMKEPKWFEFPGGRQAMPRQEEPQMETEDEYEGVPSVVLSDEETGEIEALRMDVKMEAVMEAEENEIEEKAEEEEKAEPAEQQEEAKEPEPEEETFGDEEAVMGLESAFNSNI